MPTSPRSPPSPGRVPQARKNAESGIIGGRYALERKLGSGSFGTVYLAHDPVRNGRVALKVIRTERMTPQTVANMQREFRAISSLHHRQIAAAYDFGYTESGLPFYTREYVAGIPLPAGPPAEMTPMETLQPFLHLLDALSYLHDNDFLHLDIHAGNLILADERERGSVLIDFGFLRSIEDLRYARAEVGWPGLPPELIKRGRASPRTDIFLVGRLLQYRLTGRAEGKARLPREVPGWGARLTLDCERIVARALQPAAEQRFPSVRELHAALAQALGERASCSVAAYPRDVTLGREEELAEIEERLRDVAKGKPAVLAFSAKAGYGKTRLLAEARQRSQLRGYEVLEVPGLQDPGRGPVLIDALRGVRTAPGGLGETWLDPLSTRHGGTPGERAARAAEAYFLQDGKPLILVVDDVDAIDRESLTLLEALVSTCNERRSDERSVRGLALFLATEAPEVSWISRDDLRRLEPLSEGASRSLLRELVTPLSVPDHLADEITERSRGVPVVLCRFAGALREEWERVGALPDKLELLAGAPRLVPIEADDWSSARPLDRRVLDVLCLVGRPMRRAEIAVALAVSPPRVKRSLQRLKRARVVMSIGQGRGARHALYVSLSEKSVRERWSSTGIRNLHLRLARRLEVSAGANPRDHEYLAQHLLAAGRNLDGGAAALRAAPLLRRQGAFGRAERLLRAAIGAGTPLGQRLRLAEEMSAIAEETGEHDIGMEAMEPIYLRELGALSPREATRVRRRLGIHYHRSGAADRALAVFEEAQRSSAGADLEDVIFIDSELAEIYTFRGDHRAAEDACNRGLRRLERMAASQAFYSRMEVTLRASLGHLLLRCMQLSAARRELCRALASCRRHGTTATHAAILNNLGIVASQQNDFAGAKRYLSAAEDLLHAAGERRGTIKIASNLALVHAKLGDRDGARRQLDAAAQLLCYYPGKRLEFFVAYARGVVAHLLGEATEAVEAFERALPLGRALEDEHMVRFGEVYLADAHLLSGQYRRAFRLLSAVAGKATNAPPLLARMVHCRLYFLEALLGRQRLRERARRVVDSTPRTEVVLLEAWNELFVAAARVLSGNDGTAELEFAASTFDDLGIPVGASFARLVTLFAALSVNDQASVRERLARLEDRAGTVHRFLSVAVPLSRAEAYSLLGKPAVAEEALRRASGSIVGSPFVELDWRIELLRARLASQEGDVHEARRHLHRSIHTRDLLLELVPANARDRFLAHARFEILRETERRLRRSPRLFFSTAMLHRSAIYEGMTGRTAVMRRVFETIEKVSDQEINVVVSGETGTGKELVARAIHRRGIRAGGPFMAVPCASLVGEIFESELLGSVAGAYTGAEDRPGILETLSGGTLLLDAVDQLPPEGQSRLLQVLDSRTFRPLGGVELRRADVRFIASTSQDVNAAVASGRFRADLFYRLRGVEIELPPLRDRREDIALLARHFLEEHADRLGQSAPVVSPEALEALEQYPWPGNVRELEGALLRVMVTLPNAESITRRDVQPSLKVPTESSALFDPGLVELGALENLKQALERQYLTELFFKCEGDTRKMMEHLNVKSTWFYTRLKNPR